MSWKKKKKRNDLPRRVGLRLKTGTNRGLAISEPATASRWSFLGRTDGGCAGCSEAPPHPPAAEDPAAAAPEPRAGETCRVRAGAWPRREAQSAPARGSSRAPAHPLEAARPPSPVQPARSPSLRAPGPAGIPGSPTPARPLTPGERGPAAPSRACPFRLAQSRGLRGPSIAQAPRRSLAFSFSSSHSARS